MSLSTTDGNTSRIKSMFLPAVSAVALVIPEPNTLFSAAEKHLFDHTGRVHPVYFEFPFQRLDDVSIDLPLGWQITTVPPQQKLDAKAVTYTLDATNDKGTLHLNRVLTVDLLLVPVDYYGSLRKIFQVVRTGDEEQVILQPGGSTASN